MNFDNCTRNTYRCYSLDFLAWRSTIDAVLHNTEPSLLLPLLIFSHALPRSPILPQPTPDHASLHNPLVQLSYLLTSKHCIIGLMIGVAKFITIKDIVTQIENLLTHAPHLGGKWGYIVTIVNITPVA